MDVSLKNGKRFLASFLIFMMMFVQYGGVAQAGITNENHNGSYRVNISELIEGTEYELSDIYGVYIQFDYDEMEFYDEESIYGEVRSEERRVGKEC